MAKRIPIELLAHTHAGEKGDVSTIMLIPFRYDDYQYLVDQVSAARVKELFAEMVKGEVERYELPGPRILNFVMREAMDGGSTLAMFADRIGKTRASLFYQLDLEVADDWVEPHIDELGVVT